MTGNGELELWTGWPGGDLTAASYEIRYVGIIERFTAQTRKVLEDLGEIDPAWTPILALSDDADILSAPSLPVIISRLGTTCRVRCRPGG